MTTPEALTDDALYRRPNTFMGLPSSTDATGAAAAILGCPFDCGTHPFRVGSRQGPQAIRDESALISRYQPDLGDADVLSDLAAIDAGDVRLVPTRAEESFAAIEEAANRLLAKGAVPIGFGGDGSISLPLVRAASRHHQNLVLLHFDSHTDSYDVDPVHKYDAATQFAHAAIEHRLVADGSYHVGIRGTTSQLKVYERARKLGYTIITMGEFMKRGHGDVLAELQTTLAGRPVYLSWDMDVFDPSCAPGVCTPVWGGFSAREGLEILRDLAGLNIVGADVNTVSPPHDHANMTAYLAGAVTYEILCLVWRARHGASA